MTLHLTQGWSAAPAGTGGTLALTLHNLGQSDLSPVSFCYTSLTRIDARTGVEGGTLVRNEGSFVEAVPDAALAAGGTWTLHLRGTAVAARTRTQGVQSARIALKSGATMVATRGDAAAINAMAFPRLAAVTEAAWTPASAKSWDRFCALSRLVPQL